MLGKDPFDPVLFGLLLSRLGTISSEDMPLFEQVMGSGKIPLGVQSALLQKWNELGLSEKFTLTTALSVITKDDTSAKIGAFKALFLLKDRRRDAFDAVLDLEKNNQIEKQLISWVRAFGALFQEGEASFLSFFTPLIKDGEGGEVREPLALIPKDIAMKAIRGALASGSEDGILNGLRLIRELPYQSLSPSDEFNALSGDLRAKVRVETLRTLLALAPDYPLTKQLLRSVVLSKLGDKLKGSELTEKGRSVIASLVESDPQNAIRVTARAILSR